MTKYAKRYLYAMVGTGEFLLEKGKELGQKAIDLTQTRGKDAVKLYDDLASRGEKMVAGLRDASPAKAFADGTKQAQRQLKEAASGVRRALGYHQTKPATSTKKAS